MAVIENQELLSEDQFADEKSSPSVFRRAVVPAVALTMGLVFGGVAHSFTEQGRLRPPMKPEASAVELKYDANMSALESKTTQVQDSGIPVPFNGWCGQPGQTHIRCQWPGTCCIGPKGNICGGNGAFCAVGTAGAVVCAVGGVGCVNDGGAAYCCAQGNKCSNNVCVAGPGQCFPGEASVTVKDVGAVPLQSLRHGDSVLVKNGDYERVLGFLHVTGANEVSNFLAVKHTHGQLRVSPHHVVFVEDGDKLAADLVAGDRVLVAEESGVVAREVLSVMWGSGRSGMFAPMTPSGTIVVDNVAASNYASYAHVSFPHAAFHAVFFPVRAFHALGLASLLRSSQAGTPESLHPYAALIWQLVGPMAKKIF